MNVTAFGEGTSYCQVGSWGGDGAGGMSVSVVCTDQTGAPVDSLFTATYSVPPASGKLGYVWANQPSTASYTPDGFYQMRNTQPSTAETRSWCLRPAASMAL